MATFISVQAEELPPGNAVNDLLMNIWNRTE
jgi:hypothetical protein